MKIANAIINAIFILLILLAMQNAYVINRFQDKLTEMQFKISSLEYKNYELSEQIKKIKFRNVFWSQNEERE